MNNPPIKILLVEEKLNMLEEFHMTRIINIVL